MALADSPGKRLVRDLLDKTVTFDEYFESLCSYTWDYFSNEEKREARSKNPEGKLLLDLEHLWAEMTYGHLTEGDYLKCAKSLIETGTYHRWDSLKNPL